MNLKIEFKGKVHKLAPSLKSLEDIHNDVKLRYPNCFKNGMVLAYIDNGSLAALESFQQLQQFAVKAAGASIKLRVLEGKELPTNVAELNTSQYADRKTSREETGIFEVVSLDEPKKVEEPFQSQDISVIEKKAEPAELEKEVHPLLVIAPAEVKVEEPKPVVEEKPEPKVEKEQKPAIEIGKFYACYQCRAKPSELGCTVCDGTGRIHESHPLVAFIDELMNDRLQGLLAKHLASVAPVVAPAKEVKIEQKKPVFLEEPSQDSRNIFGRKSLNDYSFSFCVPPQNKIRCKFTQQFLWNLKIQNNGGTAWPRRVYIYRVRKGGQPDQVFELSGVMPSQNVDLTIGFRANRQNTLELYDLRLGYVDLYEGIVFFGPKFGFELDTREQSPIEKLKDTDEMLRQRILAACRQVKHQRHSTAYLLSRVRQLNFTDDVSVDILADIIASLQ